MTQANEVRGSSKAVTHFQTCMALDTHYYYRMHHQKLNRGGNGGVLCEQTGVPSFYANSK